jgi:hypothetical protein
VAVAAMFTSWPSTRGLHSSTSQLKLSRFWSLNPQQASTSQLNLRHFCRCDLSLNIAHNKCSRQTGKWTSVFDTKCLG